MVGFNFPHHVTVGHILPALPMYFYGLFLMVRPFLPPDLRDKQTQAVSNQRWAVRLAFMFFLVGLIYGGIHLGITLNCDNHACRVRNWTHTFVGVSLIFSGIFQLLMASPGMKDLTVDFAGPLGFAGIGTALVMHLDHDNTAQNVVHVAFALSMFANAVLWGIASVSPRWNITLGFSMVVAAVLLSASSDEFVDLAQKNNFGYANLVMMCVFVAALHAIAVMYWAINRGRVEMVLQHQKVAQRGHNASGLEIELTSVYE